MPRRPRVLRRAGPLKSGQSFSLEGRVWTAYRDPASGATYFYDTATGSTQWADPRPDPGVLDGPQPYAVRSPKVQPCRSTVPRTRLLPRPPRLPLCPNPINRAQDILLPCSVRSPENPDGSCLN